MQYFIGILAGHGILRFVEWFCDVNPIAGCLIAGVSSGVIAFLMDVWRDRKA